MKSKPLTALAAATLLALTGCNATTTTEQPETATTTAAAPATASPTTIPDQPDARAPTTMEYAFATGMTFGKFRIPSDPDKGFLKLMERYDDDTDQVQFVTVKVDNREGFDNAGITEIRGYDKDGKEYLFVDPSDILDMMFEEDQSKLDYDKEYMPYFEKFADPVSVGEVGEQYFLTMDELPNEFRRVIVKVSGEDVEAVTVDEAEEQGIPLDF